MITTYFAYVEGKQLLLWTLTAHAFWRELAPDMEWEDMALFSPIRFGGL